MLGERERLLVTVLGQGNVGLVVTDDSENVERLNRCREPLGLAQGSGRFLDSAALCEHDP